MSFFRPRPSRAPGRRVRPGLELLEDRTVPTVLVSGTGLDSGNELSYYQVADDIAIETTRGVSADGRYVVFTSLASDLTSHPDLVGSGSFDVYVRDLQSGAIELVSVTEDGFAGGGHSPVISGDGRHVAFVADGGLVCLRDLDADTTLVVGSGASPTISDFGDAIAFVSASSLDPLDTNDFDDVYIYYPNGNQTVLASYNPATGEAANGHSFAAVLAVDGSRVSFLSDATNLTSLSDTNDDSDLFCYQPVNDTLALVNVSAEGGFTTDFGVRSYRADNFGLRFAFPSASFELVDDADVGGYPFVELYLRDITESGGTTLITRLPNGHPSGGQAGIDYSISDDGEYVAFTSGVTDAYTAEPIPGSQLYLFDAISNFYILVSETPAGTASDGGGLVPVVSQNGRYVLFVSATTDLVEDFTPPNCYTLFVRDLFAGRTYPVSTDAAGTTGIPISVGNYSGNWGISRDGNTVVFTNAADDGAYGITDTNDTWDVFATAVPQVAVPAPTVTVNQAADQDDPTEVNSVRFTVRFSLPVTGFGGDDLSFAGSTSAGTLSGSIETIDYRTYVVTVTGMTGSGDVVLSIPAGAAAYRPPAGQSNLASTSADNRITYRAPVRPAGVKVVTGGGGEKKVTSLVVRFSDDSVRKIRSPLRPPKFSAIRAALVDLDGDDVFDAVRVTARAGTRKVRRVVTL